MASIKVSSLHQIKNLFQILKMRFSAFGHKYPAILGALHGLFPELNRDDPLDLARFAKLAQKGFTEFGRLCYDTAHSREAPQEGAAFSPLMT